MIKQPLQELLENLERAHAMIVLLTREAYDLARLVDAAMPEGWSIQVIGQYLVAVHITADEDQTIDQFRFAQKMVEAVLGAKLKRDASGEEGGKVNLSAEIWHRSPTLNDYIHIDLHSSRTIGCKLRWEQEIRNVPILDPGCLDGVPEHEPEIRSELQDSERERGAEETLGGSPAGGDAADVGAAGDQVRDGDRDPNPEGALAVDFDPDETS
jgi:hypothetical protein